MRQETLTVELLRSLLHYNEMTGIFTWLVTFRGCKGIGAVAGSKTGHGYIRIIIAGRKYYAHRLAWFYVHGVWPPEDTDHINGDSADNRISNLRLASRSQNNWNTRSRRTKGPTTSDFKGVCAHKKSKINPWHAQITVHDRNINLGYYPTEEAAFAAYAAAVKEHYGEFAPEMEAFMKKRGAKNDGENPAAPMAS